MNKWLKVSLVVVISASLFGAGFYSAYRTIKKDKEIVTIVNGSFTSGTYADRCSDSELSADNILEEINDYRNLNGLNDLKKSDILNRYANVRADEIYETGNFNHETKYGNFFKWYGGAPYPVKGQDEDLAKGVFSNSCEVVDGWKNSPAHNRSILDSRFDVAGISISGDVIALELGDL